MYSVSAIALSGLQAAQTRMSSSAHNIANSQTEGFRRERAVAADRATGGVDVTIGRAQNVGHAMQDDVVGMMEAKHAYLANLAVFRAHDRTQAALLDTLA